METKIGTVKSYEMLYDPRTRKFVARTADGDEVASALTQEKLEEQIDKLSKQKFTFPIKALRYRGVRFIDEGRVTSLNIPESSVWFCTDEKKGGYSDRGKVHLRYDSGSLFEMTELNDRVLAEIRELMVSVSKLEEQIETKAKTLEKPINLKYFGLESRY